MLLSFLATQPHNILIAYEGERPNLECDRVEWINLKDNFFLKSWVKQNADIIPPPEGNCSKDVDINIKEVYGSPFNSRAAQFFRKIVAISLIYPKADYDFYVFVDCDCKFLRKIPDSFYKQIAKYDLVYLLGKFRKNLGTGVESGILGFKPTSKIIENLTATFVDGTFRQHERWDDGYVLRKVIDDYEGLDKNLDLVENLEKVTSDIVGNSPWAKYIIHDKGSHQRIFEKGKK